MDMVKERLRVQLTAEEFEAKAQEHSRLRFAIQEVEELKKSHMQQFGAQLKKLSVEAGRLAYDVSQKTEERELECAQRPDYAKRLVAIIRPDTGEIVRTRPMTAEERQTHWDDFLGRQVDGDENEGIPDNEH
jgi:hypothetical protein